MTDTETLDAQLESFYRVPMPPPARSQVDARISRALVAPTAAGPRRRTWSRLRRPTYLALGLVLALGTLTAVGAVTQVFRLELGSLEKDQRTAAEINEEIETAKAVTPVPPGYVYPELWVPDVNEDGTGNIYGLGSGLTMVEANARCGWYAYWLDALGRDDRATMTEARVTIETFPTWISIADPRMAHQSVRDHEASLIAAVQAGDPGPVRADQVNNCGG